MLAFNFLKNEEGRTVLIYNTIKIATVLLVFLAIFFVKDILAKEKFSAEKFLEQSVLQTASNLRGRIASSINELNILSVKMSSRVNFSDEQSVADFLSSHISDYSYRRLVFAYPDGHTVRFQKDAGRLSSIDWSNDKRFIEAILGDMVFAETKRDIETGEGYVNEYGVPVHDKNGKILGVLGAQVYADNYMKILSFNNYNKQGYSYIIDRDGNFLIKPDRDGNKESNFFDRDLKLIGTTKEEVLGLLNEKNHGTFMFKYNGQKYAACFAIVDNPNRYVMTIVPFGVLMLHINRLLSGLVMIVITISLLLLFLLYYNNKLISRHEKVVYDIAFVDKITGGSNKNQFALKAREILNNNPDKKYAMICVEITKFRALNELYGVENANKILMDFYNLIKNNLQEGSICARDHASTFAILYQYDREEFIAKYFVDKILDEVNMYNKNFMQLISKTTGVTLSSKLALVFGVYIINEKTETIDQMYERANIAKRTIGENVYNVCRFYDDTLRAKILQEKTIEDEMLSALADKQFRMYLQPKFNLETKELAGAEALVRWIHPVKGLIPPMNFIPLFERNGFVKEVDKYIWKEACRFLSERQKKGEKLFPISVNVSRIHMDDDKFIDELILLTRKYEIDTKYLELELTESACFNNEKRFMEAIQSLKKFGFIVSMDDFGTGYSSLNMLRSLPMDVLKLDRGFIKDTIQDAKGQIVTRSIIEMANKLNMITVAEGIETAEQAEFLKSIGCKIAQGFLYGKPVDSKEFVEIFTKAV